LRNLKHIRHTSRHMWLELTQGTNIYIAELRLVELIAEDSKFQG